ncbi:bombyxin A-2 homolog [Hyposmocoma kahamanoa]|uniref:bombyxin A-2 homolog n=1 Tax=Hyposmocoma kahamanoa TaxID=1477025 RepID=UPI000E6D678C|nr:bombyxin A-2 homolog [Hyposmocoma kahamanoa]
MKLLYIIVVIIIPICTSADNSKETTTVTYRVSDQLIQCSQKLSKFIKSLCDKEYKIIKRDISSVLMEKLMPEDLKIVNTRQRLLYAEHWRRVRRQIASECCNQPCTIGNIIWYCGNSSKLVVENPEVFEFE